MASGIRTGYNARRMEISADDTSTARLLPLPWLAAAAGAYALLTVALTWPLFRHPATTVLDTFSLYGGASILIQRDINLTMWVLAWDTHALTTHPWHVFHANALYPAPYTLACSEHMLGNAPLFAPVYLLTHNPVLAHQTTLLLTFVLCGLAMAAYIFYWTQDRTTAFVAGALFAFAPFRVWQMGNLHVVSVQYLPLVLLAIDWLLDGRSTRAWWVLAAGLAASSLCSYYIGYATFILAGVYLVVGVLARGAVAWPRAWRVVGGIALAAAVVAAITIPYVLLQLSGVLPKYNERGYIGLAFLGALRGPLAQLSYYVLPRRDGVPGFLGYTVLALALLAVLRWRRMPHGGLVALGVTGMTLGLGPYMFIPGVHTRIPMPYLVLVHLVPGFSTMRVPQRFGALATLTAVCLAGLALAELRRSLLPRARLAAALLPATVLALALAEVRPRDLKGYPMNTGASVPPVYHWLAEHGDGGPLLELPAQPGNLYVESVAMYYSTYHWLPLANGYTPYPPWTYVEFTNNARHLPTPEALDPTLAVAPLRWLLLHRNPKMSPAEVATWYSTLTRRARLVGEFGDDTLYEVVP